MKLHQLQRTSDYKVREWMVKELELTPYQKNKLYQHETIRFAPFYFYERRQKEKVSILWRFTIMPFLICTLILFIGLPFTFLVTGKWGYSQKVYDNFYGKWMHKLQI